MSELSPPTHDESLDVSSEAKSRPLAITILYRVLNNLAGSLETLCVTQQEIANISELLTKKGKGEDLRVFLTSLETVHFYSSRKKNLSKNSTIYQISPLEGKPVADYVLKMKGYVEKLERLGYVLPQDVTVGLILNGLTKDFVGFVIGKGKDKKVDIPKPKNLKPTALERPAKDDACHAGG
ncbi:hypothetical protein Tco_0132899 [Tanacetum coccineum]